MLPSLHEPTGRREGPVPSMPTGSLPFFGDPGRSDGRGRLGRRGGHLVGQEGDVAEKGDGMNCQPSAENSFRPL